MRPQDIDEAFAAIAQELAGRVPDVPPTYVAHTSWWRRLASWWRRRLGESEALA